MKTDKPIDQLQEATPPVPEIPTESQDIAPENNATDTPSLPPSPAEGQAPEETAAEDMGNDGYVDEVSPYLSTYFPGEEFPDDKAKLVGAGRLLKPIMPFIEKIREAMDTSPETADFFMGIAETGDVLTSLARAYSKDEILAVAEEMSDEKYNEARTQYDGKVKARKDRQATLDKNMKMSMDEIKSYMESKTDWDEQRINDFLDFVRDHYNDGFEGKIGKKNLSALEKAFTHDEDVDTAATTASIAARNQTIEKGRRTRKDLEALSLPELQSGSMKEKAETPESGFLADLKALANRKSVL